MLDDILPHHIQSERSFTSTYSPKKIATLSIIGGLIAGLAGGSGAFFMLDQRSTSPNTDRAGDRVANGKESRVTLEEDSATIEAVKKATPSVVSIIVSKELESIYRRTGPDIFPFDDFFEFGAPFRFQFEDQEQEKKGPRGKQQIGGGSGFIISEDGLILTNKHVISDDQADYMVVMNDGKEFAARVLAKDPVNDLAIVKIEARNLNPLILGDSSALAIGQTVIAIGNTLGEYRNTVTRGVISGINRIVQAGDQRGSTETIQEAIQTDAAINPGNSGGPLLNLSGEVIGVNTAVNQAGQAIGFAIPINTAKRSVESVKQYGKIIRPWLGVRYVIITERIAKEHKLSVSRGALIIGDPEQKHLGVIPGGAADRAGLKEGDIIEKVNGFVIDEGHALANEIAKYKPGDTIELSLVRGKDRLTVNVKLDEYKEETP